MTAEEKRIIQDMKNELNSLRRENESFKSDCTKEIIEIKTLSPIQLERDILAATQIGIGKAIQESLSGYNSPLLKLIEGVVQTNSVELKSMIQDSFTRVIRTDEFKQSILDAFTHKIGRILIDKSSGILEKTVNDLRQDAVFKSKLALAISSVTEDYLKEKGDTTK